MLRTDIINYFIKKFTFSRYLEIGVQSGLNIEKITATHKDGVDPGGGKYSNLSKLVNYKMTSDEFFKVIKDSGKEYDFIFIDGLHVSEQVDKDFQNSLNHLAKGGVIMLHDTLPPSYEAQVVPRIQGGWTGDVWKTVVKLRCSSENLEITTIDTDCGCTIIRSGSQLPYSASSIEECLTWEYFVKNKGEMMNIISPSMLEEKF